MCRWIIRTCLNTCAFLMQKRHLLKLIIVAMKLLDRKVQLHIVKLFIFWYGEQEFMVRWGNSLSMTFHCSNGIMQGEQSICLCTDDQNHHLQATDVGCYIGGAWGNSMSYANDTMLLSGNCSSDTLGEMSHMLDLMTLYTTQRNHYLGWFGQSNQRVGSQQESGSEMWNLALSRNFVT